MVVTSDTFDACKECKVIAVEFVLLVELVSDKSFVELCVCVIICILSNIQECSGVGIHPTNNFYVLFMSFVCVCLHTVCSAIGC